MKYIILNKKMNQQLNKLIIALICKLDIRHYFRRITLVQYYNNIYKLSELKSILYEKATNNKQKS